MTIINYLFTTTTTVHAGMRMRMMMMILILIYCCCPFFYVMTDELWETDSGIFDLLADSPPPGKDPRQGGSQSEDSEEQVGSLKIHLVNS